MNNKHKRRDMSDETTETEAPKKQRKPRSKSRYLLMQENADDGDTMHIRANSGKIKELIKTAKDLETGTFEIHCVRMRFTTEKTSVTTIKKG